MKAEGFEYVPVDPVARQAALTGRSNLSDEDFTRQFGYGIATLYGKGTQQADPNARIRDSLSPADRRAHDEVLSGGRPEQTYFRAADTGDFSQLGGCTKKAAEALLGGTELLTTLQRKLDELDEAVLQDQRMVRTFEKWRSCVRDKTGSTFEDSEDIEIEIQDRLADIVGPLPSGESAPGEFAGRTVDSSVDRNALAELQRTEVEFSNADVACEEEHVMPVEDVVQAEKEQRVPRGQRGAAEPCQATRQLDPRGHRSTEVWSSSNRLWHPPAAPDRPGRRWPPRSASIIAWSSW